MLNVSKANSSGLSHFGSDVIGRCTLALAAGQREGRLALGLCQSAGEGGKGLDQGAALGHAHLPEFHLLASCPLLCHVRLNLTTLTQVCLVAQHDDGHLRLNKNMVIKRVLMLMLWPTENVP